MKNIINTKHKRIAIFSLILAVGLFFLTFSYLKAGLIISRNIGVCTDGADISNPDWPVIKWNTSGNDVCRYQLQISDKSNFSNILLDTGEQITGNPIYAHTSFFWPSHKLPRCPADKDSAIQDVPIGNFISLQYLGSTCYDWFEGQPLCDYHPVELQRCANWEEGCYSDESGQCFCYSCLPNPQSATYQHIGYSSWGQTSFAYQTYLPKGKTYYYQVNVGNCERSDPGCAGGMAGYSCWLDWSQWGVFQNLNNFAWSGWADDSFYAPPLVINNPPVVSNPRITPGSDSCAAGVNSASATFYWDYSDPDGDPQGSYDVDGSLNPDRAYSNANLYLMSGLSCGATYLQRVMAWDARGLASGWTGDASYTTPPLNHAPSAYNLQAYQPGDYCSVGPNAAFSWNYIDLDGDAENSYQIQVDNDSGFANPEADSGRVYSSSNSYSTTNLSYNTTYSWRVRVWDSRGVVSNWVNGSSFAPPGHPYPTINFTWSPTSPSANENVSFIDQTTVYGGAGKASWNWAFQNGNPGSSVQQNPTIQFNSEGNKQVSLRVADTDGYSCTGYRQVNVSLPLPKWKEIIPR